MGSTKRAVLSVVFLSAFCGGLLILFISEYPKAAIKDGAHVTEIQGQDNPPLPSHRNEHLGIIFKYPNNLQVIDTSSAHDSEQIKLVSTNQQADNIGAEPTISISGSCLPPGNVPKESWENHFRQPMAFADPLQDLASEFFKSYEIGTRTLFVYKQGCYECYDGWDPETQTSTSNPNTEYDGFSAYSCEAGLNRNGNKAAQCLTIVTERQKIGSPELEQLTTFFLDDFIPTLELQQGLMIRDCDGLGESVG